MKTRSMLYCTLSLFSFSVHIAFGQASAAVVPAIVSIPVVARLATSRRLPVPVCEGELLVHKKNEIVCATPGIDWSKYRKVEVSSVQVVPSDTRRPLTKQEVTKLADTLTESLQQRFAGAGIGTSSPAAAHTLKLRAEVVEVRRTNRALNIVTLAAIQAPVSFGGATAHFELTDTESGQIVARIDMSGRGRLYDVFSSTCRLGHAERSLTRMPKQLDRDMQTLRSNSNAIQAGLHLSASGR